MLLEAIYFVKHVIEVLHIPSEVSKVVHVAVDVMLLMLASISIQSWISLDPINPLTIVSVMVYHGSLAPIHAGKLVVCLNLL